MDQPQYNPAFYQLIGPIEDFYQIVPIRNFNRRQEREFFIRQRHGFQQDNNNLVLIPLPYLDNFEQGEVEISVDDEQQYQLVGPIGVGGNELLLVDEEFYQLAPPNELDAPAQLLAIEGPPQFQLVGPVPRLARIRCRFANESPRNVDLVWTDNDNHMYRYAKLAHEEFVDITTFEGHQWIFCDALDGELYLINPGSVKKFVATTADIPRGRLRVSAVRQANELTLRKIVLRHLAQKLFDAWELAGSAADYNSDAGFGAIGVLGPMNLLIQSMRLPPFIQVQLVQFVLSCILYQMKFEAYQISNLQRQIFAWLVQFVQAHMRAYH